MSFIYNPVTSFPCDLKPNVEYQVPSADRKYLERQLVVLGGQMNKNNV